MKRKAGVFMMKSADKPLTLNTFGGTKITIEVTGVKVTTKGMIEIIPFGNQTSICFRLGLHKLTVCKHGEVIFVMRPKNSPRLNAGVYSF